MRTRRGADEAARLEQLGLAPAQARAYLTLLSGGPMGGPALAELMGVTRTSAYNALRVLSQLGFVESGAGYASRFRAVPPEEALPALIDRRRVEVNERLTQEEALAKAVAQEIAELAPKKDQAEQEVVEIIRNRRAVGERFERLEAEAQEEAWVFVKAPFATSGTRDVQEDAMRRGVRCRGLYEQAIVDDPEIARYLGHWIAGGEEARVYPGELPFKMALFDGRIALMPLETPDDRHAVTSILIRHRGLGLGLRMLFECLWERSAVLEEGRVHAPFTSS